MSFYDKLDAIIMYEFLSDAPLCGNGSIAGPQYVKTCHRCFIADAESTARVHVVELP